MNECAEPAGVVHRPAAERRHRGHHHVIDEFAGRLAVPHAHHRHGQHSAGIKANQFVLGSTIPLPDALAEQRVVRNSPRL